MKAAGFPAAFAFFISFAFVESVEAQSCRSQCAKAFVSTTEGVSVTPYFGNVVGQRKVGVHVNENGFNAATFSETTVLNAIGIWSSGCPSDPLPSFESKWGSFLPLDWKARMDPSVVLSILFLDDLPTKLGDGKWRLAEYSGGEIAIFARCPSDWLKNHPERCDGTQVDWNSGFATTVLAHEIGHALGLAHDKCDGKLMQDGFNWGDAAPLTPEHCQLASAINDAEALCGQTSSVNQPRHPCELCQVSIGGTVEGLDDDLHVDLTLHAELGGTNLPQQTKGRTGTGFKFEKTVPEGASWSVSVGQASEAVFQCQIGEKGSGTAGTADVTDVQVVCECVEPTNSRCLTDEGPREGQASHDLVPENEMVNWCALFSEYCSLGQTWLDLGPWYWIEFGPNGSVFIDDHQECDIPDPEAEDPQMICTNEASFTTGSNLITLSGPTVMVDSPSVRYPAAGTIEVTGWMKHSLGVRGAVFYVDEKPVQLTDYTYGLSRPDACSSSAQDCDTMVGFSGLLDTRQWPDGSHLLTISAISADLDYPIVTRYDRTFETANTCAGEASLSAEITSPAAGAVLAGDLTVLASASGSEDVERLRLLVDGLPIGPDFTSPYRWTWTTTDWPDGEHVLSIEARDVCGNTASSPPITVTVGNANDAPRLALEAPTPLLTLSGTAAISGWALDEDAITSVSLRLGGQTLPLASPVEWVDRSSICNSVAVADPRCPRVGWRTSFDTTLWPDGQHAFSVVVLDGRGAAASHSTWITIRNAPVPPPTVSTPQSKTVVAGDDVSFAVTAAGEGLLDYEWQVRSGTSWIALLEGARGGRVSGVRTAHLQIIDTETADQASYRCVVSNASGSTASSAASLTVHEAVTAPTVTAGLDQRVTEGESAYLSVSAQGVGPLTYRWQKWVGSWVDLTDDGRTSGTATPLLTIEQTEPGDAASYRCLVSNPGGTTSSDAVGLTVDPVPVGTCQATGSTLCFHANRFAVTATVNGSPAQTMPFSQEGGFFWVFEPQTVEVVVKILDGTSANGHFWVFHGSLTDLAYTVTVTDTITGATKSYLKTAGHFCGDADTAAFGGSTSAPSTAGLLVPLARSRVAASSSTPCASSPTAACLLNGKFKVEVLKSGAAQPGVAVTDLSASFGFVTAFAPEVVVKLIDGTSVNGWYWLFFGSLTHQDFTVRVTDSADGEERTYVSPGQLCGGADTTAF